MTQPMTSPPSCSNYLVNSTCRKNLMCVWTGTTCIAVSCKQMSQTFCNLLAGYLPSLGGYMCDYDEAAKVCHPANPADLYEYQC